VAAEEIQSEDCLSCHDTIHADTFSNSIHGSDVCTSCHSDIKELPHPEKLKKVDCASCHTDEVSDFLGSDHGVHSGKDMIGESCANCHGNAHTMVPLSDPTSPVSRVNVAKTCATCHEDAEKMHSSDLLQKSPFKSYLKTVHGVANKQGKMNAATCTDCHGVHAINKSSNPDSLLNRMNAPQTCGKCHKEELAAYSKSIHGRSVLAGKGDSPVCTDCHGEHNILSQWNPDSRTYVTAVSEQVCGSCHEAERITTKYRLPSDRLKTYRESYHGLTNKYGVTAVANCASCHGAHDILPSSDPASSVHKSHLAQTCGKCHVNAGEQLSESRVHLAPSWTSDRAVFYVTIFYWILIVVVLGGMIFHNALDFMKKVRLHYAKHRSSAKHSRFNMSERIQHWLLTLSFMILAYTGFSLKFPDEWWALPLTAYGGPIDLRGVVHRAAAIVFTVLGIYHVYFMLFTRRGHEQLKALFPRSKDLQDFERSFAYYFNRSDVKPKFERYGYTEKLEYWALIWGSVVMVGSGVILTFADISMRFLPKWVMDVATTIHYYEAILATLAVIIWHFYFTIYDPDHYPLNMSMFSGKSAHGPEPEDDKGSQDKKEPLDDGKPHP
jgi:cytochrome b subunit of formate dehydrogenase